MKYLLFAGLCIWASLFSQNASLFSEVPEWVERSDVPAELFEAPEKSDFFQPVSDVQYNYPEKSSYTFNSIKILSKEGLGAIQLLPLAKDLSCQSIKLHNLRIYRKNKWIEPKLLEDYEVCDLQGKTLANENDLENGCALKLHNIEVNDLVEFSFTITGAHPTVNKLSLVIPLDHKHPIGKHSIRFLTTQNHSFSIQNVNTSIQPSQKNLPQNLCEWRWEQTNPTTKREEQNQPVWFDSEKKILISEYKTWEEAAELNSVLFRITENNSSETLTDQILSNKLFDASCQPRDFILNALRFVQDEIKYSAGYQGYKAIDPASPTTVIKRGYGDCKDKTLLLKCILDAKNISSTPILVSSKCLKNTNEFSPTPSLFDHVILRIDLDDKCIFVDPSIPCQGGDLENIYLPNYGWGLPLSENSSEGLIKIPNCTTESSLNTKCEVIASDCWSRQGSLKVTFSGLLADEVRREYKELSSDSLPHNIKKSCFCHKHCKNKINKSFHDNREKNEFTIVTDYPFLPAKNPNIYFVPTLFNGADFLFSEDIFPFRKTPVNIIHPMTIKEEISVELPFEAFDEAESTRTKTHKSAFFSHKTKSSKNKITNVYEIKTLKDHATPKEIWSLIELAEFIKESPQFLVLNYSQNEIKTRTYYKNCIKK